MKKAFIVFSTVLLLLVLASCVSTSVGNAEKDFFTQVTPEYQLEEPVALMSNGTQVGTVTVTNPAERIFVKYETDYRMELIDEKIYTANGELYHQYYTTNPPDRYSFVDEIDKPFLGGSLFKIKVWVSKGCNYYPAYLEFTIGGASPKAEITAVPSSITGEYDWVIEKTATPNFQYIFALETKVFDYTVEVTKIPVGDATQSSYMVDGILEVWEELGLEQITVTSITLTLVDGALSPIHSIIIPPSGNVINPPDHEFYPYSMDVTNYVLPGLDYHIIAEVLTDAGPTEAQAGPFQFVPGTPTIDDWATVVDEYLPIAITGNFDLNVINYPFPTAINASTIFNYSMEVTNLGAELEGFISNTATVTEQDTGENDSDDALVEFEGDCAL